MSKKWPSEGLTLPTVRRLEDLLALRGSQDLPLEQLFIVANGGNAEHFLVISLELYNLFNVNIATAWYLRIAEIFRLVELQPSQLQLLLLFLVHAEEEFVLTSQETLPHDARRHRDLEVFPVVHLPVGGVRVNKYLVRLELCLDDCGLPIFGELGMDITPETLVVITMDLEEDRVVFIL